MSDWIKTSEKMPEENSLVLFVERRITKSYIFRAVRYGYYAGNGEWKAYMNLGAQTVSAERVTHWMYRPELPKEDE